MNCELQTRINMLAEADPLGYWYQPVEFGRITAPTKPDQHPASFGRGKWDNYVKPFLDKIDRGNGYFCEMGCNGGLYLVMAAEAGFRRMWGVEAANAAWGQLQLTAEFYNELDIRPVYARLGTVEGAIADSRAPVFDQASMPIVDVTLMAQFLYWVTPDVAQPYVDALSEKSCWAIVLTNTARRQRSSGHPHDVEAMFDHNWLLVDRIETKKRDGRRRITALLFHSRWLEARRTKDLWKFAERTHPANRKFYHEVFPTFCKRAAEGHARPPTREHCAVWNWLHNGEEGSTAYPDYICDQAISRWHAMAWDIPRNGQTVPIMIKRPGTDRLEGHHRVAICHYNGIPRVYAVRQGRRASLTERST